MAGYIVVYNEIDVVGYENGSEAQNDKLLRSETDNTEPKVYDKDTVIGATEKYPDSKEKSTLLGNLKADPIVFKADDYFNDVISELKGTSIS